MPIHAVTAVSRGVGRTDPAPQVEGHIHRCRAQGLVGPATLAQGVVGGLTLRSRIVAVHQAGSVERGAARIGIRHRRDAQHGKRARHQQRRFGGDVVQRAHAVHQNVGLAGHHRIEPVVVVFRGTQYRAAPVGHADGDHADIIEAVVPIRIRLVEHVQAELRRLPHMASPVRFRVVLRVGVLERDPAGAGRRVRHERQRIVAVRSDEGAVGTMAHLGVQVEVVGARPLVGVRHRASLRQSPGAGDRDRTVDAA